MYSLSNAWFKKIFEEGNENSPLAHGPNIIMDAFAEIQQDNQSRFNTTLKKVKKDVPAQDDQAKPDNLIK